MPLSEYQEINPIAMDKLFILAFFPSVSLGKGKEEPMERRESFLAEGGAHSTHMLRCPRLQEEAPSVFLLETCF